MKNLLKFILPLALVFLFTGCEKVDDPEILDGVAAKYSMNDGDKMVTLGFNIKLFGTYEYQGPDMEGDKCGLFQDTGFALVINTGVGTGTHFKKVTSYFEFCVNPNTGTYPENDYLYAYLEDEDGDQLFVEVAGQVLPGRAPGMPDFALSYFKDPFTIIGGTGKFEGASGGGFTNDYNFIAKDGLVHTSHHWQGKITMKKGK